MTTKGDADNLIDKEGNLCLQFGCRKGEVAIINHSNKLECSDYTNSVLNEFQKAKKAKRELMIPRDLIMTQFTKERGESSNMASDNYVLNLNFKESDQKPVGEPKALKWSPEQVQKWFDETLKLDYPTVFSKGQINGEDLMDFDDLTLQELGMTVGIHRKKTLKAIEALKTQY